uniref:Ig-like domain-containing protein n=1 Tax=Pygocentrus nattereri TaxID=42514 RepID=A0AAR2KRT0_PYGNA
MSDTAVLETLTCFNIFTECRGKDTVFQPRRQQWASERETVTLDCEYNTTNLDPTLLWYQQKDHHSPKYILLTNSYGAGDTAAEFRERFHSKLNSSTRRAPLMIQKLSVSDSAVYYCALQPTHSKDLINSHHSVFYSLSSVVSLVRSCSRIGCCDAKCLQGEKYNPKNKAAKKSCCVIEEPFKLN